ncbi:nucleotidyltransferase domain-containing protein [Marinomonas mediterranea]|uniref:nucleotidyltransferase domain-containing protein n=1 Tax=Marinomonas mediterranea TaxID=119864 RepID=UPI00234949F2|nr:nucleotidyltransferase domain-containing protein [Marinomonas mediterranea]WCN10215.1 nucleotidyltransferase domain-containing protein [Marinomonas mediterranea]
MLFQKIIIDMLITLSESNSSVNALWLYGSRAKGNAHLESDFDLAVMFDRKIRDPLDNRLRPELLAEEWRKTLNLPPSKLSILDVESAPLPIAFNAINGELLYCRNNGIRMSKESVIMSKIELDLQYHLTHFENEQA